MAFQSFQPRNPKEKKSPWDTINTGLSIAKTAYSLGSDIASAGDKSSMAGLFQRRQTPSLGVDTDVATDSGVFSRLLRSRYPSTFR